MIETPLQSSENDKPDPRGHEVSIYYNNNPLPRRFYISKDWRFEQLRDIVINCIVKEEGCAFNYEQRQHLKRSLDFTFNEQLIDPGHFDRPLHHLNLTTSDKTIGNFYVNHGLLGGMMPNPRGDIPDVS